MRVLWIHTHMMLGCPKASRKLNSNSAYINFYLLDIDEQEVFNGIYEDSHSAPLFSAEEEVLFSRRFENGYDLPDPKYLSWLRMHHPIAASVLSETVSTGPFGGPRVTPVHVNIQSDPVIESLPIANVDSSPIVDNSLIVEDSPVVETPVPLRSVTHSTSILSATPSSTGSVSLPKRSPLAAGQYSKDTSG